MYAKLDLSNSEDMSRFYGLVRMGWNVVSYGIRFALLYKGVAK